MFECLLPVPIYFCTDLFALDFRKGNRSSENIHEWNIFARVGAYLKQAFSKVNGSREEDIIKFYATVC